MSAFLVSPRTITRVIVALNANGVDEPTQDRDLLGMMLYELNVRALRARYPGDVHVAPAYRYVPENRIDLMQHYKSLRCFLYQCGEGDVPEQPLYLRLVAVRDHLAHLLGHNDDGTFRSAERKAAYDRCEWD